MKKTSPRPPPELSIVMKAKLDTKELGSLLRTIRISANMTQVELARKLGIPQQNVAQFETGDRELMLSTMNKYVRALGWELTLTATTGSGEKRRPRKTSRIGDPRERVVGSRSGTKRPPLDSGGNR